MTRVKAKTEVKEGLAFLIEDALERSEVVIAAESIVEKLQSIAEDLANLEAKDIMPLFDALTNAFGPEIAQKFNAVATEQVRQLVGAVQTAKASLDGEIVRLKKGVEGGSMDDMSMGDSLPAAPMGGPGGEPPPGGPSPEPSPGGLADVPPPDMASGPEEMEPAGIGPSIGRARKESIETKGKLLRNGRRKVTEFTQPPHESVNLNPNLENLSLFHGGAGRLAQGIANMIRTDKLSLDERKALANVLSHIASVSHDPTHWSGVDADSKLDGALKAAGLWQIDSPVVQRIVQQLKRLSYLLNLHHEQVTESNIKMLRTANNPDALILKTFRTKLAENRDGQMAAIRTARTFAIDIEDVVAVVKEAAARRPFHEARIGIQKLKIAPKRGRKEEVTEGPEIASGMPATPTVPTSSASPNMPAAQPASASNIDQEIPMFPVEQGRQVDAGPVPSAPNANVVQPMAMQPPGATRKPLSPADMRSQQQQQQTQQAQQNQIATNVQQGIQPRTPQPQGQATQTGGAASAMPGQVVTKNNPALKAQARPQFSK